MFLLKRYSGHTRLSRSSDFYFVAIKQLNTTRMEVIEAIEHAKRKSSLITIEATVDTGFENVALEECKEIFGSSTFATKARGRIYFNILLSEYEKVLRMRSVDNLFLIGPLIKNIGLVTKTNKIDENTAKDEDLKLIEKIVQDCDWKKSLNLWQKCVGFKGIMYPTEEEYLKAKSLKLNEKEKLEDEINKETSVLRYRATCYRSGTHSFGSMDAARVFGGKLQDLFLWVVDLTLFNLEVVLNIVENQAFVGFALTKQSMHRRNITHFGPTTLRATVAFCLLHVAKLKPGDIVIDPLGGGGSIPIEGALAFPGTYYLCGDYDRGSTLRSSRNMQDLCTPDRKTLPIDVLQWNATMLTLRTASVDAFVTDLPFGKRSGLKRNNKSLYHKVLLELGRVVRPTVGRAVLLTHDRRSFEIVASQTNSLWKQEKQFGVNLGGLNATVFHLLRTSQPWVKL